MEVDLTMFKKLFFLITMTFFTITASISAEASCGIWRKTDPVNAKIGTSLSGDYAPIVYIGWSDDHKSNLNFYATLEGAEWNYGKSGTIQQGVTYQKINSKTLMIYVKVGTGEDEIRFNRGKNIHLPVDCTISDAGDIRLIIDSNGTTVSNANIVFAKGIDGNLTVSSGRAKLNSQGYLKKITVNDSSSQAYNAGSKIKLSLDSGFKFGENATVTGYGKFKDKVEFKLDTANQSIAYLVITEKTDKLGGSIAIENAYVKRNSTSKFNIAMLNVKFDKSVVPLDSNLAVISYSAEADTTTRETTTEATTVSTTTVKDRVTENTTKPADVFQIQIGADSYSINGINYPIDAAPYIKNGRTMLPLRAVANAVGIDDANIRYNAPTKTATLISDSTNIYVTSGEGSLVKEVNGTSTSIEIDAPAEIRDGRIFLPFRAIANALGIDNSNISYNNKTKTVSIILN